MSASMNELIMSEASVERLIRKIDGLLERLDVIKLQVSPIEEKPYQHSAPLTSTGYADVGLNPIATSIRRRSSDGVEGLPSAKRIRMIIANRKLRSRHFDADLFADPAWDILLDLAAAAQEGRSVSVTSACIASGVPSTTALRWISVMTVRGLLLRCADKTDRRRAFIELCDTALVTLVHYFSGLQYPHEGETLTGIPMSLTQ